MYNDYFVNQNLKPILEELATKAKPNYDTQIGIIAGNLTIGGMEIGTIRLAKILQDLGYKTWVAFKGLNAKTDHEIGTFITQEKVNFESWNTIRRTLTNTDVVWLSQSSYINNPKTIAAINNVEFVLEFFGQPAGILPEVSNINVDICVVKSESLTKDIKARRKNLSHYLTFLGIPVKKKYPSKLKHSTFTFVSISRMDNWQKRLGIIIEAANKLEGDFQLLLAGDGPAKGDLETLAQGNEKIKFLGWIDAKERDTLLQKADVFLSPGVWEGVSRSIREAMMYGLPILTSPTGGTEEFIEDKVHGILLPVHDAKNKNALDISPWQTAMQHCLDNDLTDMGKAARKMVLELNLESKAVLKNLMGAISNGMLRKPGTVNVSVITPAYNVEDYITDCVVSVANQEFNGSFEHIVVNDGSTDKTSKLLDELAKTYSHLRVIHLEENGGCNAARNRAVLAANGEAIVPLDSDDELLGNVDNDGTIIRYNWLQTAWDVFVENNKNCLVYGRTLRTVPEKGLIFPRTKVSGLKQLVGIDSTSRQTLLPVLMHPRSACIMAGGWHWKGGEAGSGLEDAAYNIELLMLGYKLVYEDSLIYHWRFRKGSRSRIMDFKVEWDKLSEHYKPIVKELV